MKLELYINLAIVWGPHFVPYTLNTIVMSTQQRSAMANLHFSQLTEVYPTVMALNSYKWNYNDV